MNILLVIAILLVFYWRVRSLYYYRLNLKYKYEFYRLRDKLRQYAIEGKIDSQNWMFSYLDTSISKTVANIERINFFTSILLYRKHKKDTIVNFFAKKVDDGVKKNPYFKEIFTEYGAITFNLVLRKHYWLHLNLKLGIWSVMGLSKIVSHITNYVKYTSQAIRVVPETSSMTSYVPSEKARLVHTGYLECVN